jgi:hypothetical protein
MGAARIIGNAAPLAPASLVRGTATEILLGSDAPGMAIISLFAAP